MTMGYYRGYGIDYNVYGRNEYTVQVDGDDLWFWTVDEAKRFIERLASSKGHVVWEVFPDGKRFMRFASADEIDCEVWIRNNEYSIGKDAYLIIE